MNAPFQRVVFLEAAMDDLRSIPKPVALEALRLLKQLDRGAIEPIRLQSFGKTGDLTDCGKLVVLVAGHPEHRVVVRELEGRFELVEVVAVQERQKDLSYLLAGLRLERIADPVRRADTGRAVFRLLKKQAERRASMDPE